MIKYALRKNQLAANGEPNFVAYVSCMASKTIDDLVTKMVEEGTGLTRPQAMAYFEKLTQIVINFLEDGCAVNTPLFRVRPSIKGVFTKYNDIFDSSKQKLNYSMTGGTRMEPVLANIIVEKLKSKIPFIETFFDGMSRLSNSKITPGGNAEIKGECLLFNLDDPGGHTVMGVTLKAWQKAGYDKTSDGDINADDLRLVTYEKMITGILNP